MATRKSWCPDRRDMIWIDCNPQAGREMRDRHPLMVLSPREFNERTGIVIGLPMTTASYTEPGDAALHLLGPSMAPRRGADRNGSTGETITSASAR